MHGHVELAGLAPPTFGAVVAGMDDKEATGLRPCPSCGVAMVWLDGPCGPCATMARRARAESARRGRFAGQGTCIKCRTARRAEGSPWCATCGKARASEVARNCELSKQVGKCTKCTAPAVPGLTVCPEHRTSAIVGQRARADEYRAAGVCVGCGGGRVKGSIYCAACRLKAAGRRSRYRSVTPEEFDRMLTAQDGVCAICGGAQTIQRAKGRLFIDHCHAAGKIRGLLCHHCNVAIGSLRDDPRIAVRAAAYLRRHASGEGRGAVGGGSA